MATASEVVRAYLEGKTAKDSNAKYRAIIHAATAEIVAEMPNGFTAKDARACVATYLAENPDLNGASKNMVGRAATGALNALVNEGALRVNESGVYAHVNIAPAAVPVGL